MLDFPLMLPVKLSLVDRIHPQSNKFATGVENKVTAFQEKLGLKLGALDTTLLYNDN